MLLGAYDFYSELSTLEWVLFPMTNIPSLEMIFNKKLDLSDYFRLPVHHYNTLYRSVDTKETPEISEVS